MFPNYVCSSSSLLQHWLVFLKFIELCLGWKRKAFPRFFPSASFLSYPLPYQVSLSILSFAMISGTFTPFPPELLCFLERPDPKINSLPNFFFYMPYWHFCTDSAISNLFSSWNLLNFCPLISPNGMYIAVVICTEIFFLYCFRKYFNLIKEPWFLGLLVVEFWAYFNTKLITKGNSHYQCSHILSVLLYSHTYPPTLTGAL